MEIEFVYFLVLPAAGLGHLKVQRHDLSSNRHHFMFFLTSSLIFYSFFFSLTFVVNVKKIGKIKQLLMFLFFLLLKYAFSPAIEMVLATRRFKEWKKKLTFSKKLFMNLGLFINFISVFLFLHLKLYCFIGRAWIAAQFS